MKQILLTTIAAVVLLGCGNPEADRALLDASEKENIEAVKQHLDAGADVNAKDDKFGFTPLHYATFSALHLMRLNDHKEIVELLIAEGARLISFEAHELGSIWGDEPKRSISPAQE